MTINDMKRIITITILNLAFVFTMFAQQTELKDTLRGSVVVGEKSGVRRPVHGSSR